MTLPIAPENFRRMISVLALPRSALDFGRAYWPERAGEAPGVLSKAAFALLGQLQRAGHVMRVDNGGPQFDSFVARSTPGTPGTDPGAHPGTLPGMGPGSDGGSTLGAPLGLPPVDGVRYDVAYGNVQLRGDDPPLDRDDEFNGWPLMCSTPEAPLGNTGQIVPAREVWVYVDGAMLDEFQELVREGRDRPVSCDSYSPGCVIWCTVPQAMHILEVTAERQRRQAALAR